MTFLDMIINLIAGKMGLPQMNDVDDYVPIKPQKNNYIDEEDLDFPPLPDDEEFLAPPVPEDDDFDGIAPAVPE